MFWPVGIWNAFFCSSFSMRMSSSRKPKFLRKVWWKYLESMMQPFRALRVPT